MPSPLSKCSRRNYDNFSVQSLPLLLVFLTSISLLFTSYHPIQYGTVPVSPSIPHEGTAKSKSSKQDETRDQILRFESVLYHEFRKLDPPLYKWSTWAYDRQKASLVIKVLVSPESQIVEAFKYFFLFLTIPRNIYESELRQLGNGPVVLGDVLKGADACVVRYPVRDPTLVVEVCLAESRD